MSYDVLCLIINPVEFQQVIMIFKIIIYCLSFNQLMHKFDIQVSVHHDIIYENDQQDATM